MRKLLALSLLGVLTLPLPAAVLSVRNPSSLARQDWPVVVPAAALAERGLAPGADEAILVQYEGQPVASQLDDLDGNGRFDELVFVSHFRPNQVKEFTLSVVAKSQAPRFTPRAHAELGVKSGGRFEGDLYKGGVFGDVTHHVMPKEHAVHDGYYRYEGPGWESDKIAWRMYLDKRNAIDIFGKRIPDMILHQLDMPGAPSYHDLQDWGTDALKVGETMGVGGLGMLTEESGLRVVKVQDDVEARILDIIADGPVRAVLRQTCKGWKTPQGTLDAVQEIRVYAGQHWFENRITITGIDKTIQLVSGIVKHLDDLILAPDRKLRWMATHGPQEIHGDVLGMGVIFPTAEMGSGDAGEATGCYYFPIELRPGRPGVYWALAAWEREDPRWRNQADFVDLMNHTAACLAEPLQILPDSGMSERARLERGLRHAQKKLRQLADQKREGRWPASTELGRYAWNTGGWTGGFFPGSLWQMAKLDPDPYWRAMATFYTAGLSRHKTRTDTHDLGFLFYPSLVEGFKQTGKAEWRDDAVTAAHSLARRYNPRVGAIRSWGALYATERAGWTIIDNMMNLDLLFWASETTGDASYARMALTHSKTTARFHVRPDGSSYHIVSYDPATGKLERGFQGQGYNDDTTWSRGQAWGAHGYSAVAGWTKDPEMLAMAWKMTDYIRTHLPVDKVPYWDYQAPNLPNAMRDTSAAAIYAAGLLKLARAEPDAAKASVARDEARAVILSLCDHFLTSEYDWEEGVLREASAAGGRDSGSLPYGDYYFMEALAQLLSK
ncbi:DUF4861 family protein [bacterium]|nr:DUF4861 family protein [bacterium]